MNSESSLVMEVWDLMRDALPSGRRQEAAIALLRSFEEYGFEGGDLTHLVDEDEHLTAAHRVVFGSDDEDEDYNDEYEE